ncbi:MAG: cobalamin biosynthesis protein, partial [Clostridia bacterium]|nr:cobalamin biosynthesis protein [Clostridia bacterium]
MKICIFCFSDSGSLLAKRLCGLLELDFSSVHSIRKFADKYSFTAHNSLSADMGKLFSENDALIFIGACGIAVREIAPHIKSKTTDPAVLVIDDRGSFVIPVLSGHIGGANELSKRVASLLCATEVITTSTDGAGKFSCDGWASSNGYVISSLKTAKEISASILTGDIPISSEYQLPEILPDGLVKKENGSLGIYIGVHNVFPYENTLSLIPKNLTVGIGCRRGTAKETIAAVVKRVFEENKTDLRGVKKIASIDLKKDEEGLIAFANELGAELVFYSADELNGVTGEFRESEFVKKIT